MPGFGACAALLALLLAIATPAAAGQPTRRLLGGGAVLYQPGTHSSRSLTRAAGNAVLVIEVPRSGPLHPLPARRKSDPRKVLHALVSNSIEVRSQPALVETFFHRAGVIVPASFRDQNLFGKLVPTGQERNGDVLYFGAPGSRAPTHSALFMEPDRLLYYSDQQRKILHARRDAPPWPGPCLFVRRVLGTAFENYMRQPGKAAASRRTPPPSPLPEHYDTDMEGLASLYGDGDGSHGHETANGEIFNEEALTAAHRTLPFNTWLLVTNTENGRRVIVRVNDRGPFAHKERVLDLSFRAARLLGMDRKGTAHVKLSVIRVAHENDS